MRLSLKLAILFVTAVFPLSARATEPCFQDPEDSVLEPALRSLAVPNEKLSHPDDATVRDLKQIFLATHDVTEKQNAASALLTLGEQDPAYFDYLSACARRAIEDDTPWPFLAGQRTGGRLVFSQAFLDWCAKTKCKDVEAAHRALYIIPGPVLQLASAGDPRARSLLRCGLRSRNQMVFYLSALGLARLHDEPSVSDIVRAIEAFPAADQPPLALVLVFFDSHEAQAAADRLVADRKLLQAYRTGAAKQGTKLLFGR